MAGMNIHRIVLGNGEERWVVRWSRWVETEDGNARRKEEQKTFRTEDQARRYKHHVEASKNDQPADPREGKRTVAYWADLWLTHREGEVVRGRIRPSSLHGNRRIVALSIKPMLGVRRVRSLTVDDIEQFIERVQVERAVTPATAKHHYGVLRQVLAYAVRKQAISINAADGVRADWTPPANRPPFEPVALSEAEVRALVEAMRERAPGTPWPLLIEFMAYTGLRAGEVAGLNVGDLRILATADTIKRAEVHVRRIRVRGKGSKEWQVNLPKTGKIRRVPVLPSWLRSDLAAFLAQHPHRISPSSPMWPGLTAVRVEGPHDWSSEPDYGKPWDRDPFYKNHFRPALKLAGLPHTRLHDLRHTAGSIMLAKGIPPYRVAEYLGHSVDMLLRIYASVLEADVDQDAALFTGDRPAAVGEGVVTRIQPDGDVAWVRR